MMQRFKLLLLCFLSAINGYSQISNGYIIEVNNNVVYVDLTTPLVKVGDVLGVYVHGGYMTDPQTGRRVRKGEELKAKLKINSVHQGYSITFIDGGSANGLTKGMTVRKLQSVQPEISREQSSYFPENKQQNKSRSTSDIMRNMFVNSTDSENESYTPQRQTNISYNSSKHTVVVAPAQVNDVVHSGHFGGYVADVLMEQLLMCNEVRLLDRSVLNAQIDEINLAGDIIDSNTAIQRGKVAGARYIIQVTMQKPDVVNIRTGIPLASVMGAIGAATGKNVGAQYASNMEVGTLKASVTISTRVVDLQTGEVLFMTSGTGKAKGKSQLSLEYGALGGAEINGGADGFKQTITGKAIQQAFMSIGRNLQKFFAGETTKKVMGSSTGYGNYGQIMAARGMKLYIGSEKLDKEGVQMAFAENQRLFFKYKDAKRLHKWGTASMIGGVLVGIVTGGLITENHPTTCWVVVGTCVAGGIGGGIYLYNSAKKKVRQIADEYNRSQTNYADASLNLILGQNNIGLRLTF